MHDSESASGTAISSAIVDYPARDMTITVGAGMSYGTLQTILREENQQLPIDVADEGTPLGELAAYDICGPRQFGYGSLRDYVIGVEAVDGTGRVFHAGGRVVKNVAGYDLCRLLVGSRNQLGTITQLTFKLKPLPTQQSIMVAGFRSLRDLEAALERLNLTATTPVILDVLGRSATSRLLATSMPELAESTQGKDAAALLVLVLKVHWPHVSGRTRRCRKNLPARPSGAILPVVTTYFRSIVEQPNVLQPEPMMNTGWHGSSLCHLESSLV